MDIARSTQRPPSRLLMPLAYGSLLGGLTTLIGTPPNLLVSFALQDAGFEPFKLLDFTPVGMGVMLGGIIFVAFIGRHLLPKKDLAQNAKPSGKKALTTSYDLQERTFMMRIGEGSELAGKTLAESRLRAALGINVLSVNRQGGGTILDPGPDTVLRIGDKLFVQGRHQAIKALKEWVILLPQQKGIDPKEINLSDLDLFEASVGKTSELLGLNPLSKQAHKHFSFNVLAIKGDQLCLGECLKNAEIQDGDILLLHGPADELKGMADAGHLENLRELSTVEIINNYHLHEALFIMEVKEDSELFDKAIAETQLGEALGLTVLGIIRQGQQLIMPKAGENFQPGDNLLVQGEIKDLNLLQGLMHIELLDEQAPSAQSLETADVQMAEVVLAPRSLLAGKTLREINFRKKYGLTVLAIWREGRAYRTNLHNLPLRFGEALLIYGKRDKLELIGSEQDFILLTDTLAPPLRTNKAFTATLVMLAVLLPVLFGLIPLAIMAVLGIAMMVLTGCLKMEEAYRAIEWRSVFLIAGLLPLGAAMHTTGAAAMLAEGVVETFGRFGPWGVLFGLYLLTVIATLAIPPSALVVIMSPVVLQAAESFSISPHSLMMAIAIAAAGSFLSPIAHPANLLVMGPGGYKFSDYLKLGLPLSLVVMALVFLLLPIFWPF
jgi:di/tricarboxylate transporter